jgi:cytochrome c-type biogenesis protein CcmH/NrfG
MVTRLTPDNSRGHYNLAAALYHLDRFEEAMVCYQRSIEIQPTASAWSGLGTVHYFMGNYSDAERAFEMAAALKPSDPRLWGFLASARKHLPDGRPRAREAFDRAIALVRERLRQNPNSAEDWSWLAGWLGEQGEALRAIEAMDQALSLAPHDVDIMARAGALHGSLGQRAVAVRWLGDALKNGYRVERLLRDPDLEALRDAPELKRLIQEHSAFAESKQVQSTEGGRP